MGGVARGGIAGDAGGVQRAVPGWPFDLHSYWARPREPDLADYDLA